MTLTTIGIILFLVCAVWFGLVYYAATVLPKKLTSKLTQSPKKEKESLFTKFFYF